MIDIIGILDTHHFKTRIIIGFLYIIQFYVKRQKTWDSPRQDRPGF